MDCASGGLATVAIPAPARIAPRAASRAAPVIAAILVTNIALAVLGRAAPQLQIMSVAFPIQIGIGLLTFAGSLGLIVHALSDWTPAYARTLDSFARAVQVAPVPATGR